MKITDLTLMHYSKKPIVFDPHREYREAGAYKPHGFWVSVLGEDDWPAWCQSNDYDVPGLAHAQQVTLRPDAKVRLLTTTLALDKFTGEFGRTPEWAKSSPYTRLEIDWDAVARSCQGLIIAPYQYNRRHEHIWYYGWDCASGCLWDLSVVEKVWTVKGHEKKRAVG